MKAKILLVTEYLNPPYDEGIKKTVFHFYNYLKDNYQFKAICRVGSEGLTYAQTYKTNRFFISRKIRKEIIVFDPDCIIYFPFVASTFASFIRNWILSNYFKNARNIMISLQPKPLRSWQKGIIKFIKPSLILSPSPKLIEIIKDIGIPSLLLPLYTDENQFSPIPNFQTKIQLRDKYNIEKDVFVVLHVGHLNEGRNLMSLIPLQQNGYQVIIVGSSSTPPDSLGKPSLKRKLEEEGIIIFDGFTDKIQEFYQLSDLYIFPVISDTSSIGMPLSILEARSCGIPVLMAEYGSVRNKLGNDNNNIFYSDPDNFATIIEMNREYMQNANHITDSIKQLNEEYYRVIKGSIANA